MSIIVDPAGSLTDVSGIAVGHHQRRGRGWRTGTTAVVATDGATAGVDVRGGGPGTRETDLLRPENLIQQVHGICLTGGSAFGLAAADGMMHWLESRHIGFPVGQRPGQGQGQGRGQGSHWIVPIVPAAVIFDLGRGGVFANRPDAGFGWRAAQSARSTPEANGTVGAGTGAVAGGLQGGVGSASTQLSNGIVVAALAVVNAAGSLIDPASGLPWEFRLWGTGADRLRKPSRNDRAALEAATTSVAPADPTSTSLNTTLNTTIGVVATTALLTKAECNKVASVSHDGLARAIRPVHSMFDGDTIFSLATGVHELPAPSTTGSRSAGFRDSGFRDGGSRPAALNVVLEAAALCFAAACTQAILSARSVGGPLAYCDLCPSAFAPTPSRIPRKVR